MKNEVLRRRLSSVAAVVAVGAAMGCSGGSGLDGSSIATSGSSSGTGPGSRSDSGDDAGTSSGSSSGSVAAEAGTGSADATTLEASVSDSAANDATVADAAFGDATTVDSAASLADGSADDGWATGADGSNADSAADASGLSDAADATADGNGAFSGDYTFDTTTQGWSITGTSDSTLSGTTLTWTGTPGDPTPGALELTIPFSMPNQSVTVGFLPSPTIDLTGRVITVQLYLASGLTNDPSNSGGFQVFAQSGPPNWSWQSGSSWRSIDSAPSGGNSGVWITSSLDLGAAAASNPSFDPTDIIGWGIQILSGGSQTTGAISTAVIDIDSVTIQ